MSLLFLVVSVLAGGIEGLVSGLVSVWGGILRMPIPIYFRSFPRIL